MGIELSSFYPQNDESTPEFLLNGENARVKVGFVPSASVTKLGGGHSKQLSEMVLIGVVINPQGDILKWIKIPPEIGRTDDSDVVDWQARLEKAMQLFQSE